MRAALFLAMAACAAPRAALIAQRPYRAEVPYGYDARSAAPVFVEIHGFDDDAESIERLLHLRGTAQAHGAILVRVEGTFDADGHRYWNTGTACCDLHGGGPDDLAYLDAVLDDLSARYRVDPARIYLVGHSNGGFMAHAYACARAERIGGIASIAGGGPAEPCRPRAGLAVLHIHGDADELVDAGGGNVRTAFRTLRESYGVKLTGAAPTADFPPAVEALATWARRDGCAPAVTREPLDLDPAIPGAETSVTEWPSCRSGGVALWMIHGGRHDPNLAPDWGERLWSFFAGHPVARAAH